MDTFITLTVYSLPHRYCRCCHVTVTSYPTQQLMSVADTWFLISLYDRILQYIGLNCIIISLRSLNILSLRFNGHFPGEPGLGGSIAAKDDGGGGDNWN